MKISTIKYWANKSVIMAICLTSLAVCTQPASAKQCHWTVKGSVAVQHQLTELKNTYGAESSLRGVQVKVSAKSKVGPVWGTPASWGVVRTNSNGGFSVSKTKGCGDRKFKVEVKFDDDDLEVRHSTATSSLTKVKWYTIQDWVQRDAGTYDLGKKVFKAGGRFDLGDSEPRQHADVWIVYHDIINFMRELGSEFAFTTKIKVKPNHNSAVVDDSREASYANPTTKVIYIFEKHFNTSTLAHEIGHIWAYNHMSGEICLTEGLLISGDTHGLVKDHCVAHGEGFAEWFKEVMMKQLYGVDTILPYNRAYLHSGGLGPRITNRDLMQRIDWGWTSVFRSLATPSIHKYDFKQPGAVNAGAYIEAKRLVPAGCDSPRAGHKRVFKVFNANPDAGYPKKLARNETTITAFLKRAKAILQSMDEDNRKMFAELSDPSKDSQPSDWLCDGGKQQISKKQVKGVRR